MSPFFGDIIFFWVYVINKYTFIMNNKVEKIRKLIYDELSSPEREKFIEDIKRSKKLKIEYAIQRVFYEKKN